MTTTQTPTLYKMLSSDGRSPYRRFVWPLPTRLDDGTWAPGEWVTADGVLVLCGNGLHLLDEGNLSRWQSDRLFVAESGEEKLVAEDDAVSHDKIVVRSARLLREIEAYAEMRAARRDMIRYSPGEWAKPRLRAMVMATCVERLRAIALQAVGAPRSQIEALASEVTELHGDDAVAWHQRVQDELSIGERVIDARNAIIRTKADLMTRENVLRRLTGKPVRPEPELRMVALGTADRMRVAARRQISGAIYATTIVRAVDYIAPPSSGKRARGRVFAVARAEYAELNESAVARLAAAREQLMAEIPDGGKNL